MNTIFRAGKISLEEINRKWVETDMLEGIPMVRSTFNRHKDAIQDIFGIVWVSGYRPQLDSIQIFQRTEYITKEITPYQKPKRWGIGLQAGYGVALHNGQIQPVPYIGLGLSYSLISW